MVKTLYIHNLKICSRPVRTGIPFALIAAFLCSLFAMVSLCARDDSVDSLLEPPLSLTVRAGEPSTICVEVPDPHAISPFRAYIASLSIGRPLPWPYLLEGFSLKGERIFLSGRFMATGTFEVPLGIFSWEDKTFELPVFRITTTAPTLPSIGVSDLLLPFPEMVLEPSYRNHELQTSLSSKRQCALFDTVRIQKELQILFYWLILLGMTIPIWSYLWKRVRRVAPIPTPVEPTIAERLQGIQSMIKEGKRPWTELLELLNCFKAKGKAPLTSYELVQYFIAAKEDTLSKAATLIDQHSYRVGGDAELLTVVQLLMQRSCC